MRAASRPIEKRQESKIEFIGEKTGPAEDDLKKGLLTVLGMNADVQRAYLAIVSTDGRKSWSVALCLVSRKSDEKLIHELGAVFRGIFSKDQFLDVTFQTPEAELQVQSVCRAFYEQGR